MNSKHTPGPWTANEDGLVYSTNKELGKQNVICAVHPNNATLIAAAPELLAALEGLLSVAHQPSHYTRAEWLTKHPMARAAVNKAKGAK